LFCTVCYYISVVFTFVDTMADPRTIQSEFKRDEIANILEVFRRKGLKPKADTPEQFEDWFDSYVALQDEDREPGKPELDWNDLKPEQDYPKPHGPFSRMTGAAPYDLTSSPVMASPVVTSSPVFHQLPRLTFFSGETGKDTEFEQWNYEVKCLSKQRKLSEGDLFEVIRRSLKGEAATIARNLGPQASIDTLLSKFQSMYGGVEKTETRLSQFYSAKQGEEESVSSWCCRLEVLFAKAMEHNQDPLMLRRKDSVLRNMLWTGLKPSLKTVSGYKFDQCTSLNTLLVSLRVLLWNLNGRRRLVVCRP